MTFHVPYSDTPISDLPVVYEYGPHSSEQAAPRPGVTEAYVLETSSNYPGTSRRIWVHVPNGVLPGDKVELIFFQDGGLYLDEEGPVRGGLVLDNLCHLGLIPPAIGVFVDPGVVQNKETAKNRNVEYDPFDNRYANFLVDEIAQAVAPTLSKYAINDKWVICGGSSGGNCAFTAAWQRPDKFKGVISFLASFPQLGGDKKFPDVVRDDPQRQISVFMQAAQRDLNWGQSEDNWFASNLQVASELELAGHDLMLVVGQGEHSPNHGGVLLPDALRWVFSDERVQGD